MRQNKIDAGIPSRYSQFGFQGQEWNQDNRNPWNQGNVENSQNWNSGNDHTWNQEDLNEEGKPIWNQRPRQELNGNQGSNGNTNFVQTTQRPFTHPFTIVPTPPRTTLPPAIQSCVDQCGSKELFIFMISKFKVKDCNYNFRPNNS